MRIVSLICLGGLLVLAACAHKPGPAVVAAPTDAVHDETENHVGQAFFKDETEALAAYPDLARRDGDRLIITVDGHDRLRLTSTPRSACEGWETCSLWQFVGMISLDDGHGMRPLPAVGRDHGEGVNVAVVAPDGSLRWGYRRTQASALGHFLASGELASPLFEGHFKVIDWRDPRRTYESPSPCEPMIGDANEGFRLSCSLDEDSQGTFEAEAVLVGDTWQLTATKPEYQAKLKPAHVHVISDRELRDLANWEAKQGVERLS